MVYFREGKGGLCVRTGFVQQHSQEFVVQQPHLHQQDQSGFRLSLRCSQRGTRSKILFENENYVGVQLFCEFLGPLPTGQAHSASCSCLWLLHSLPDFHLPLTSLALGLPLNPFPGLRPQDVRKVACSGLAACPCQALSGLPVLFRFSVLCWFFLT